MVVARVHVAEIIAAGTCKAGHGVGFELVTLFGCPVFGAGKRWFSCFGGQVSIHPGQPKRKFT